MHILPGLPLGSKPTINPLKSFEVLWSLDQKLSKYAKFWLSKSIFYVNNDPNLSKFLYHWRMSFDEYTFWYWHFLTTSYLNKFLTTFTQLTARIKNFLMDWLMVLGLNEGLAECATLCLKSWVILTCSRVYGTSWVDRWQLTWHLSLYEFLPPLHTTWHVSCMIFCQV